VHGFLDVSILGELFLRLRDDYTAEEMEEEGGRV